MRTPIHRSGILRPSQVRNLNSGTVLQLLRRFDRLSRADIARHSGLTESTISRIVSVLVRQSLVTEVGAINSTGGRPATRLQLSDAPLSIGVEIQNWDIRFAVANFRGQIIESQVKRTPVGVEPTIELVADTLRSIIKRYSGQTVHGIGVAVRGIVNSQSGVVEMGNTPGWAGVQLRTLLESALRLPVHVENDVRAATSAEYHYTEAGEQAPHCLLYMRMDEGVGIGIMLNGRIYAGPSMSAGEFGQMVVADGGGTERHDRPGCLESLVSNAAICDRYAFTRGKRGTGGADSGGRVRRICQQALDGDADSIGALTETARFVGLGISNLIWGLDPEVVVLSSALNVVWPLVSEQVHRQLPDEAHWPGRKRLLLKPSGLGEDGVLIGAATLAFAPLFATAQMRTKVPNMSEQGMSAACSS